MKKFIVFTALLIMLAGCSGSNDNNQPIASANTGGALDTSFATTGKVTTEVGIYTGSGGAGLDYGYSVAIQPDGKIVVAGTSDNTLDFAVVRYNADGFLPFNLWHRRQGYNFNR